MKTASVIIVSRNRTRILDGTVRGIISKASSPEAIEVIVRIHRSDRETMAWAESLSGLPVHIVAGDDHAGYASIDRFVNCAAAMASGNWLLTWSDDNRILTQNWDQVLTRWNHRYPHHLFPDIPGWRIPILSRKLYDTLGHAGHSAVADVYIDYLSNLAGISSGPIPIKCEMLQGLPLVAPRDLTAAWLDYGSDRIGELFELDKAKLGAVLGRQLGKGGPRDQGEVRAAMGLR